MVGVSSTRLAGSDESEEKMATRDVETGLRLRPQKTECSPRMIASITIGPTKISGGTQPQRGAKDDCVAAAEDSPENHRKPKMTCRYTLMTVSPKVNVPQSVQEKTIRSKQGPRVAKHCDSFGHLKEGLNSGGANHQVRSQRPYSQISALGRFTEPRNTCRR